jgi:hypothetical protein
VLKQLNGLLLVVLLPLLQRAWPGLISQPPHCSICRIGLGQQVTDGITHRRKRIRDGVPIVQCGPRCGASLHKLLVLTQQCAQGARCGNRC